MGWLTDDDLRQFAVDGYLALVVRDVVPELLLAAADAETTAQRQPSSRSPRSVSSSSR